MKLETDVAGSSEQAERPDCGTPWLPALLLSALAILLRILVATRREGIEIDGITYQMPSHSPLAKTGQDGLQDQPGS